MFISLRGLFLVTGQFAAAREHILAFSSVLKHGLVPNLLDSGKTPRYNCRDGPWFMLQNIQDYVNMAPNGIEILREKVKRRFPLDDEWVPHDSPKAYQVESTVAEVIQEILQRHAQGIHFREYNAGPNLDMQMSDQGFNIDIDVDWKTGIIYGGNEHNCGTWQDKMVSSSLEFRGCFDRRLTDVINRAKARRPATKVGLERLVTVHPSRLSACSSRPCDGSTICRARATFHSRASRRQSMARRRRSRTRSGPT